MCAAPHNRTRTLEGLRERFGVENSRERARERESKRENEKERQRVETQDWARNEGWSDLFFKRQGPDGVNVVRAKARDEKASATDEDAEGIEGGEETRADFLASFVPIHAARWEAIFAPSQRICSLTEYDEPGTRRLYALVREHG